ncbi:WhiB family transcriptional regulator [Rhodococcoides kyotonense]|uniref:Transcriptional regulator WhiB n=1 Tax=Rhodococcoides kyotonense TaxID=398843 RepID=A0A239N0S6_9NOCA|nr:WhiB family transcriptional regulator [Rhodococcus kyotonensis]SNT47788.1 WhiB family transcriptional regulator, redox-sensing transcriptional regulator [Rhodococcus kyotonensis]
MRIRDAPTRVVWLPLPRAEEWEWQLRGSCREKGSSAFFHPWNERGTERVRRDEEAKQICSGCDVLTECRRYALEAREPFGVWGGMSESDRAQVYRSMGSEFERTSRYGD